jgi:3',5'-cyclic-AMP phosphodiesterase
VLGVRPVPDALLLGGDVATAADPREYARVAELLGRLPMPAYVLPGNHDDPARLRDGLDVEPTPFAVDVAGVRLIGLDTHVPGSDAGALGLDALSWLADALDAARETPTIVAMHHPPIGIAMAGFDAIALDPEDASAFAELVAGAPHVVRVLTGHVHRAVFGMVGGRPLVACPSTYLQSRLALDGGPVELVPEPPAMLLHVWRGGELVSHVQPI